MLEIGSVIDGKYKILNQIGKGGMSVVYLAINEAAQKTWAIKEVRKDGVQDSQVVMQGLIAETDMLKRLHHPNLPSIIDVIDRENDFLIVMDYIEGKSLAKNLSESGAQPQEYVIEWGKQLCDVLGYLHSRKPPIIYRDMKPANVMLKPDGNITLIDFGTAREFKNKGQVEDTYVLGTQGYAAPEQFGGQGETTPRTDIYGLGATLYHLVTGHNPAKPPYEMYPIRQWNQNLSEGLEQIILKCTKRNPDDRYQSCSELLYALEHYDEIDRTFKRSQRLIFSAFALTVGLSAAMFVTAGVMHNKELGYQNQNYESYYEKANEDTNKDEFVEDIQNALNIDATKYQSYRLILSKFYANNFENDDDNTEFAKYNDIKNIVEDKKSDLKTADPYNYYEFCYNFGTYIWTSFSTKNSKNGAAYAKTWLSYVEKYNKNGKNNNATYENAQLIIGICDLDINSDNNKDARSQLNSNESVDYQQIWQNIKELNKAASDKESKFSAPIAKVMCYQKMLSVILNHYEDFNMIDNDEIEKFVDSVADNIKDVDGEGLGDEVKNADSMVDLVKEKIKSVENSRKDTGGAKDDE